MDQDRWDAIVIGAGHNGLAAAILLAKAGWRVLVLERNRAPGGAVRTEEVTLPGFRHDLFAGNLSYFHNAPFYNEHKDELTAAGLTFLRSDKPFSSAFPDGDALAVSTDLAATMADIARVSTGDAQAWGEMVEDFERQAPHILPMLGAPLPSLTDLHALVGGVMTLGTKWPEEAMQLLLQSSRAFLSGRFESEKVRALCGAWACHGDLAPDIAGGTVLSWLEPAGEQLNGAYVPRGGAAAAIDAMVKVLESHGGSLRCEAPVAEVAAEGGRASAVVLESGERLAAVRAVIANLAPTKLFGDLVRAPLPDDFQRKLKRYTYCNGTMMIHLALSDLPDWRAGAHLREHYYVHLGPYLDDMALAYQRAQAGLLAENPFVAVSQPTVVDPSRAPDGKHVVGLMVCMVPSRIRGDAAGEIAATHWDDAKEAFADRVVAKVEDYAPGFTERILGRCVLSPLDLERHNPNLVGGDMTCGSMQPMQNFFMRPFPGWARYRTPIKGLYLCGAATWPGAGTGAASGRLLGKMLTGGAAALLRELQ